MKTSLTLSVLMTSLALNANPFNGGDGDGNTSASFAGYLDGSSSIYFGGNGDGHHRTTASFTLGSPDWLDSDGDGMPDAYEIINSLNPAVDDSSLDADSDGVSNGVEYVFCTDPQDAGDATILSLVLGANQSTANLVWPGKSGKLYDIFISEDLKGWTYAKSISAGSDSPQVGTVLLNGESKLFFQIQINK